MRIKLLILLIAAITLSACLYKHDIHQGNVLEVNKISQLKPGMNKKQVINLLGSPQLIDPFHSQRWDYFSSNETNNQKDQSQAIVTLFFEEDRLVSIEE